ncbi:hypothetical protein Dimus_022611 [Dionaea muscipula]
MHDPICEMYFWFFLDMSTCNNFLWKCSASGYGTLKNSFAVFKTKNKCLQSRQFYGCKAFDFALEHFAEPLWNACFGFLYDFDPVGVMDLCGNIFLRMIELCC